MNQDFSEYLNKKSDMYEVNCDCGNKYFVFVKLEGGYSVCRTCSKKHYELSCKHCDSAVNYVDGSKEIDFAKNTWLCVECKETNENVPTNILNGYQKDDIPKEVWREQSGRKLMAGWILKLIGAIIVGYYIYIYFIR